MLEPSRCFLSLILSLAFAATAAEASDRRGPPLADGPVVVDVGFYLSGITSVSEEDETIEFAGVLTLRWHDPRQAFDPDQAGQSSTTFQGNFQFNEVFNGWWPQIVLKNEAGKYERQGVMLHVDSTGDMTYIEEIDAIAETRLKLRRFPFDRQDFYAIFEVLGYDRDRVVLRVDPTTTGAWEDDEEWIRVPQWHSPTIATSIREYDRAYGGTPSAAFSAFVFGIGMERDPGYLIRLVIFPLTILVILSWSVFWMSRSSLGDRMDLSFIGILSIVAYQITISELMPRIAYSTILSAYFIISFLMMAASVVVNLVIGRIDESGNFKLGDLVDRRCRIAFPVMYVLVILIVCGTMYRLG